LYLIGKFGLDPGHNHTTGVEKMTRLVTTGNGNLHIWCIVDGEVQSVTDEDGTFTDKEMADDGWNADGTLRLEDQLRGEVLVEIISDLDERDDCGILTDIRFRLDATKQEG